MLYITPQGSQEDLESDADYVKAIHLGKLSSRTLVYDDIGGRWIKAMEHPALARYFPGADARTPADHSRWLTPAAILIWTAVCVLPAIIGVRHGIDPEFIGEQIGTLLILTLVGGLGLRRLMRGFSTRRSPHSGALTAVVLGLLCGGLEAVVIPHAVAYRQQLQASARNLQNALDTLSGQAAGQASAGSASPAAAAPDPQQQPQPAQPPATGSAASPAAAAANTGHRYTPPGTPAEWGSQQSPQPAPAGASGSLSSGGLAHAAAQDFGQQDPQVLNLLADVVRGRARLKQQFDTTLAGLHLQALLQPQTLVDDAGLRAGTRTLDAWEAALAGMVRDEDRLIADTGGKLAALQVPAATRVELLKGFHRGADNSLQHRQRELDADRAFIAAVRGLYAFMRARLGSTQVRGGQLQFASNADLIGYRSHLAQIRQLQQQGATLEAEAAQRGDDNIARIQQMAHSAAAH